MNPRYNKLLIFACLFLCLLSVVLVIFFMTKSSNSETSQTTESSQISTTTPTSSTTQTSQTTETSQTTQTSQTLPFSQTTQTSQTSPTSQTTQTSQLNLLICTNLKKFISDSLDAHNNYRKLHNSPPLELNEKLSNFAQEWTNKIANDNEMKHRPDNKYGENIFGSSGNQVNGSYPVKLWYDEIKDYNFNDGGFSMKTGHFTQVIWKKSSKLGVGCAKSPKGGIYVVANYDPPGNVIGAFDENVLRKIN